MKKLFFLLCLCSCHTLCFADKDLYSQVSNCVNYTLYETATGERYIGASLNDNELCSSWPNTVTINIPSTFWSYYDSKSHPVLMYSGQSSYTQGAKYAYVSFSSLPSSITKLGSYAFVYASLPIPENLEEIYSYAFYNYNKSSIELPNTVKTLHEYCFNNCPYVTEMHIPNKVTSIPTGCFQSCAKLETIVFEKQIETIGDYVFRSCSSLASVYCYATTPPTASENAFANIGATPTLYVPSTSINLYKSTAPWNQFTNIEGIDNVAVELMNGEFQYIFVRPNDTISLTDNIKSISITKEEIPNVNLTYTRNFSDAMVGNWQAWYMPCDFSYDDLSEDFDVAQIQGVMVDRKGETYIGFLKMEEGIIKAHTPYVVRAKSAGDIEINTTTILQPTNGAKSFYLLSATNKFTFGGVYENSYLSAEQPTYALNKSGNFALMSESVYLRPFRIYMRITDREDNPYAAVTAPQEVKVVVLGEDETSIDEIHNSQFIIHNDESSEIYNLAGQKLQKLQKGINIVNGRKVLF